MRKTFLSLIILIFPVILFSQTAEEKGISAITEDAVEAQLEFLSSDWTEGRATGTKGAYLAADYIASMFKLYGLEPGGDMVHKRFSRREREQGKKDQDYRGYFQNFQLIEYAAAEEQNLSLISHTEGSYSEVDFSYRTDFSVSPGHISGAGKAKVVFVGYGMKDDDKDYNDFDGAEIEGKIILRLRGYPGHSDENSPSHKKFKPENRRAEYYMNREKNKIAAELGAMAVLEVDLQNDDLSSWATNLPFRFNTPMYEGDERLKTYYDTRMRLPGKTLEMDPPVFSISVRMAQKILENSGIDIKKFEKDAAQSAKVFNSELKDKEISFRTNVNTKLINARNVIGVLKGKDTTSMIVVGGHYDHVGKYGGYIWNGADDNASGTVGVMTLARACIETGEKPEKTIVFAAWTGEEKGLWGSKYFADHPYDDLNIVMNLNYDMISRDNEDDKEGNKCSMTYTEGFPAIKNSTRENLKSYDINLDVNFRPMSSARGGSDHAPFAQKGIPYFYFMAGFPPEYHQPDDHIELANIPKMTNIIRIGFLNLWQFANSDEWMKL